MIHVSVENWSNLVKSDLNTYEVCALTQCSDVDFNHRRKRASEKAAAHEMKLDREANNKIISDNSRVVKIKSTLASRRWV